LKSEFDRSMILLVGSFSATVSGIFMNLMRFTLSVGSNAPSHVLKSSVIFCLSSSVNYIRCSGTGTSAALTSSLGSIVLSEDWSIPEESGCCRSIDTLISLSSLIMSVLDCMLSFKFYFISLSSFTISSFNPSISSLESI
jgi:hypothetical protein